MDAQRVTVRNAAGHMQGAVRRAGQPLKQQHRVGLLREIAAANDFCPSERTFRHGAVTRKALSSVLGVDAGCCNAATLAKARSQPA